MVQGQYLTKPHSRWSARALQGNDYKLNLRNAGKRAFGTKAGQRFFLLNSWERGGGRISLKKIPRIIPNQRLIRHLPCLKIKMYSTKLTLYLKSRVVMEPRFGSHDDGLTIYVQRSAPLVDDVILTITSQFDNRLGKTKKDELIYVQNTV